VGREQELALVRAWLAQRQVTTIVGPAGIGKSRLADEATEGWAGERYTLDLSHETDAEGCVASVARALGLPANASASDVGRALAARSEPLLLLDDADRVLGPIAQLIADWLGAAPETRVLITSRERLRIRSEHTIELQPLSLDGGSDSEAARLFLDRVKQAWPSATIDADELETWCTWLEGTPLAIELAAARAPFFGAVDGQRRLDLLRGGFRDGHERHMTLRRAIAWSWAILDEAEQRCLAEASAFTGTFHVGATARVVTASEGDRSALDVLRSLADKSFLRVLPDGRLRLYDAVREYASEQRPDEHRAAADRLDGYLATQAERDGAGIDLLRSDVIAAADRVVNQTSTLNTDSAAWVVIQAARLLLSEGPASRVQDVTVAGLRVLAGANVELLTRLRLALAGGLRMQGRLDEAEEAASAALADEQRLGTELRAQLLTEIGLARHARRNLEGAAELYARALTLSPSRRAEGRLHANLGAIAHDRGDLDTAEASYRDALIALGVTQDTRLLGVVRSNLGLLYQERGDLLLARETLEQALRDLDDGGEHYLGAIHRGNLGQLFLELSDPAQAVALHEQALARLRRIGDERSITLSLCRLAAARALVGDVALASRELDEAASRARGLFDPLLGAVIGLHQAFVPLARAEASLEPERGQRLLECRRLLTAVTHGEDNTWRLSDDARCARRILEARLGALGAQDTDLPTDGLVVCIESRFFRLFEEEWQDLRRDTPARRILESLVENPSGMTLADLQAAAWPGERIRKDAAKNRLHVALSRLRGRGLKAWIRRVDERYQLAPGLTIHRFARIAPGDDA
jgi:predicted ATPase